MKVCFAGCSGHAGAVLQQDSNLRDVKYTAYCQTYPGEDLSWLGRLFTETGLTPTRYTDYQTMIEEEQPDILVVDGIFSEHARISRYALERNISVYVDKPAATEFEDLADLEKAIAESSGIFMTMQNMRYEKCFYTVKQLVSMGAVGKVRMFNGQKSYKLGKRSEFCKHRETFGGIIPWVAIHAIDAMLWITGEKPVSVMSYQETGENFGHGELETAAVSLFKLTGEVIGEIHADYLRPETASTHGDDRLRVVGTCGVVESRGGKVYLTNQDTDGEVPLEDCGRGLFSDFVGMIRGERDTLISTEEAVYSTYAALMARESAETGKKIIF